MTVECQNPLSGPGEEAKARRDPEARVWKFVLGHYDYNMSTSDFWSGISKTARQRLIAIATPDSEDSKLSHRDYKMS